MLWLVKKNGGESLCVTMYSSLVPFSDIEPKKGNEIPRVKVSETGRFKITSRSTIFVRSAVGGNRASCESRSWT